ncbi:MAG: RNA 2',3'-cyclic phosphodiesterase [Chloroflexi bacterium]|nr:RNA 2',3'-cyclic phosphodiesterase [Chloroflexota bacterium]MBV9547523.1 RNA 2',3'-cyclic phosphodiesterase [Chloroflexota bacterium]
MRLFFAIELPADVRAALGRLQPHDDGTAYRWVDPSLMHVTLAFLDEQPEDLLPKLEAIATQAASGSQAATLRLGEAGSFGSRRAPRVFWIGLSGDTDALHELQQRLAGALRGAGITLEDRPFNPHITLARRRERAAGTTPDWPPPHVEHPSFPMNELTLFQSRLSPRGPTYTAVFRAPLSNN